jgi:Protein of unknown function (DUF2971)
MKAASKKDVWEEHDRVFHYTTQEGLEGILWTQSLHATHYRYLNDKSELAVLAPKLREAVRPYVLAFAKTLAARNRRFRIEVVERGELDNFVDAEVATMVDVLHNVTLGEGRRRKYFEPYVVAFCSHDSDYEKAHGLLSQWRAYGGGGGYALVFDTKLLAQVFETETSQHLYSSGFFGDVVYDGDEEKFDAEFGDVPGLIWNKMQAVLLQKEEPKDELFTRFLHAVSRYKHRGFKEECEVRAIFSPMSERDIADLKDNSPAEFAMVRHKKQKRPEFKRGLKPYLKLSGGKAARLPIVKIIVGPHGDKVSRKATLDKYLEVRGFEIETAVSETPLV